MGDMSMVNQVLFDQHWPIVRTGRVAFDGMGDRLFAEYQIINIQKDQDGKTPKHVIVGNYKYTNVGNAQPTIVFVLKCF